MAEPNLDPLNLPSNQPANRENLPGSSNPFNPEKASAPENSSLDRPEFIPAGNDPDLAAKIKVSRVYYPSPKPLKTRLYFIFLGILFFLISFISGILFTVVMITTPLPDGPLKEVQRPLLIASRIPPDAHSQWLDLETAIADVDHYFYNQGKVDHKKMTWAAVQGAIHALGDPFTLFREPEQAKTDQESLKARPLNGGLGVYPAIRGQKFIINQIIPGYAAEKAGLQEGDVLLKIDNSPVVLSGDDTKDIEKFTKLLRGEIGSQVKLGIERPSENNKEYDLTVTRSDVVIPPVITRLVGENRSVGYISVTTFGPDTLKQFDEKVGELQKSNPRSYILDLRSNGGGLVDVAQKLLGRFLDGGVAYYRSIPYQQLLLQPQEVINEPQGLKLYDKPLAVLVNAGTASASEITAGALQDRNRGTLVGEKTYGKGVAQYVLDLPTLATVRITFEQWFTPSKIDLTETKGIKPDIKIQNKQEDINAGRDPQLDRAIQSLKSK